MATVELCATGGLPASETALSRWAIYLGASFPAARGTRNFHFPNNAKALLHQTTGLILDRRQPANTHPRFIMVVDKSDQRVRRMFAEIASNYDRMNHLLSMQTDRYWRWRTARLARPQGDAPILDVCTGTGDLAFSLHRASGGAAPIVATDFCREMLDIGQSKKDRAALNGEITFLQADTQHLPFPDNHFQIVSVAFGLRNVADTDQGLREMARVCQPGGRVAVLEFTMPRTPVIRQVYGWYFRAVLPRIGQWLARNQQSAYTYLPESVGEFPSYEALAERMRNAGLSRVDFYPLTLGVATLYLGVK